jgi:hypothetical protein
VPFAYIDRFFYERLFAVVSRFSPPELEAIKGRLLAQGVSELEIGARIGWMLVQGDLVDAVVDRSNGLEQALADHDAEDEVGN